MNTQLAILHSPEVIDKALDVREVAQLPLVLKQKDRRTWLINKLLTKREGRSEIVSVSIKTNDADASEKIVNAVVDAYMNFVEGYSRATDNITLRVRA